MVIVFAAPAVVVVVVVVVSRLARSVGAAIASPPPGKKGCGPEYSRQAWRTAASRSRISTSPDAVAATMLRTMCFR